MNKGSKIPIILAFLATLALGAIQEERLGAMRDTERFYRWIEAQGLNMRLTSGESVLEENKKFMDDALFHEIEAALQGKLPEIPLSAEDTAAEGAEESELVRMIREAGSYEDENGVLIAPDNEYNEQLYAFASGSDLVEQRQKFLRYSYDGKIQATGGSLDVGEMQDAGVNLANVFFGFRKIAANLVWLQVDRHWHAGELYRMVPMMWTCVSLDPSFIDAYLLGAWHLAYNISVKMPDTPLINKVYSEKYDALIGEKEKYFYAATDLLKKGIKNNPRNYKLYFDLGFAVYEQKLQDHEKAVLYLTEAIRYKHDKWVPRMRNRALLRAEKFEEAIEGWEAYTRIFPNNPYYQRWIPVNKGLIEEREAKAALACANHAEEQLAAAEQSGNTAEAERWKDLSQKANFKATDHFRKAREIWYSLNPEGGDTLAKSRLLYIDAIEHLRDKEYYECIGKLNQARWEDNEYFFPISDKIIDVKLEAGIALNQSEAAALERRRDAEKLIAQKPKKAQEAAAPCAELG